jgi:hypothetical protein
LIVREYGAFQLAVQLVVFRKPASILVDESTDKGARFLFTGPFASWMACLFLPLLKTPDKDFADVLGSLASNISSSARNELEGEDLLDSESGNEFDDSDDDADWLQ